MKRWWFRVFFARIKFEEEVPNLSYATGDHDDRYNMNGTHVCHSDTYKKPVHRRNIDTITLSY